MNKIRLLVLCFALFVVWFSPEVMSFQGQPAVVSPRTSFVLQRCADGSWWVGHEWQRWTDDMLLRIAGF